MCGAHNWAARILGRCYKLNRGVRFYVASVRGGCYNFLKGDVFPLDTEPSPVLNVGRTTDGYWGGSRVVGIAPITTAGGEFHCGLSKTWNILPGINLRSLLLG